MADYSVTLSRSDNRALAREDVSPRTLIASRHRQVIWGGLVAEALFVLFAWVGVWKHVPLPVIDAGPADSSVDLMLYNLVQSFPKLLVLGAAVLLLVLLPGWIASLTLEKRPTLAGCILFGFLILGGLTLVSQFARLPSIWPSLAVHLIWQVGLWAVFVRRNTPDLVLPPRGVQRVLLLAVALVSLLTMIINPVMRLDTADNWSYISWTNTLVERLGETQGYARLDFNAWNSLNAWISVVTGIPPLFLFNLLWHIVLWPLVLLVIYSLVHRLTANTRLAAAAAWLTLLVLPVSLGQPYANPETTVAYTITSIRMANSDKWVALVLITPAGLALMADHLRRVLSWRLVLIWGAVLGASAVFHPMGLTLLAWVLTGYLVIDLGDRVWSASRTLVLVTCLIVLFVLIPLVFSALYEGPDTTENFGLWSREYLSLNEDWFIVNPVPMMAPLLIGPVILIAVRGPRRGSVLQRLLYAWIWAVLIFYIPPFANILDHLWAPTWLNRLAWSLPFGALVAAALWSFLGARLFYVGVGVLTVAVLIATPVALRRIDWRRNQQPVVDRYMMDLLDYARDTKLSGLLLTPLPGPQTLLVGELNRVNPLLKTSYEYPDILKLYTAPWWGRDFLHTYLHSKVSLVVVERDSIVLPQIGLQPDRYTLLYENPGYLLYRYDFRAFANQVDILVDQLATPEILPHVLAARHAELERGDPYSWAVLGLAYQAAGDCNTAASMVEKAAAASTFARVPYLSVMAGCQRATEVHAAAIQWRDDPLIASTLLSADVIGYVDHETLKIALDHWLARPVYWRDERGTARQVADNLATISRRPDLATAALRRLPDILLEQDDWFQLATWAVLAGQPDPALFRRAGDDIMALLLEGHAADPAQAEKRYRTAANRSGGDPVALMFLGQTCEVRAEFDCARRAYQRMNDTPGDPMAYYGAVALARVQAAQGESADSHTDHARLIAEGLSLSHNSSLPPPVIKPLVMGHALGEFEVMARWSEPLDDIADLSGERLLEVTFANPSPAGQAVYTTLGFAGAPPTSLAVYVPGQAGVTWTVQVALPPLAESADGLTAPLPVMISDENGSAMIAELPSWVPPRAGVDASETPVAVFEDGLELLDVSVRCGEDGAAVLETVWLPTEPLKDRYTQFVHLYDQTGTQIDQIDQPPFNNAYPTDLWIVGYPLRLSYPIPDVPLELRLGWYNLPDGARLPVLGDDSANGQVVITADSCEP